MIFGLGVDPFDTVGISCCCWTTGTAVLVAGVGGFLAQFAVDGKAEDSPPSGVSERVWWEFILVI